MKSIFIVIILFGSIAFAEEDDGGVALYSDIKVYNVASTSGKVLGYIYQGEPFGYFEKIDKIETVDGVEGFWVFGGRSEIHGWIFYSSQIGKLSDGVISLYKKALEIEKDNPEKALSIYNDIICKFPNARFYTAKGKSTAVIESRKRIKVMHYRNTDVRSFNSQLESISFTIEALKKHSKPDLLRIINCEAIYTEDDVDDSYCQPIVKDDIVSYIHFEDYDFRSIHIDNNILLIARNAIMDSYHAFYYQNTSYGWKIYKYEVNHYYNPSINKVYNKYK